MERLAASPTTVALMMALMKEMDVRAVLPTSRVPTLVVQTQEAIILPQRAGTSPTTYRTPNTSRAGAQHVPLR